MSKPMGAIPAGFGADGEGMLLIGGRRADALVAEAGDTPLFVYDLGLVDRKIARFRAAFPSVDLHYAIKANSYIPLLNHVAKRVDGLDIASGGELTFVREAGADPKRVSFAGPGKRDADLAAAIEAGVTLNCESEGEAERAFAIGERLGRAPRLAVRVNPDFEIKGSGMRMGGGAKPFGVDAERVPALVRRILEVGAEWRGFHIFAGSQSLDTAAIIDTQAQTVALAARLADESGAMPPLVNLGGGFGIPYFSGDTPVDVAAIGAALGQVLAAEPLPGTLYAIELGRWLTGECGVYLARVVDRKESQGEHFVVIDGGLHHQLAASGNFGAVVRRNYPVAVAARMQAAAEETVSVVGPLCTPLDRLADRVALPRAEVGDVVAIFCAGAYGASASPMHFLGHGPAREIVAKRGEP